MAGIAKPKVDITRLMFDLDVRDLHRLAVLGYGPYNSGKTFLMGDFLAEQQKVGEVAFIEHQGRAGYSQHR